MKKWLAWLKAFYLSDDFIVVHLVIAMLLASWLFG